MKKTLFLFLVFYLTILAENHAQFQIHPDSSFYTFLDSFYHYNQDDSAEGGLYNQVRRDNITWGTRLAPSGNMSQATKARNQYAQTYAPNQIYSRNTPNVPIPIYPNAPSWTELGPIAPVQGANSGKGMGQVHRLAFHPNFGNGNQILYAGSHYGGLYRTDDGGSNWYNYDTDRGLPITSVGGVAVSLNNVFVCTGNGDHGYANFGTNALYDPLRGNINNYNPIHTHGVYRNTNSNNGWQSINGNTTLLDGTNIGDLRTVFEAGGTMRQIIVHPTNDAILFIATSQGIFKTNNQGISWEQVLLGKSNGSGGYTLDPEWRGLAFHPTNPNIVYASGKDIYQSVDGGSTWLLLADHTNLPAAFPSGLAIERSNIAVTPAADSLLYVYAIGKINNSSTRYGNILIYNLNSSSWQLLNSTRGDGSQKDYKPGWAGIAVSPTNPNLVYNTGTDLRGSYTALSASGWGAQSPYANQGFHADVHEVKFPPNENGYVYVGTHGGVSQKDTIVKGSGGWTALYNGLGIATIWTFDDWEGNDSILITGNQDVGVNLTINRGTIWDSHNNLGDGYNARVEDQTGKAYLSYNTYEGVFDISSGIPVSRNFYHGVKGKELPIDTIGNPINIIAPATFPVVNHPKTDIPYVGLTELYTNITCGIPYEIIEIVIDTPTIYYEVGDTIRIRGGRIDTNGVLHLPLVSNLLSTSGRGATSIAVPPCTSIGTVLDTVRTPLLNPNFLYRIDTLCIVNLDSYDIRTTPIYDSNFSKDQVLDSIWSTQSNLKTYFSSKYSRRILEIAFSEDQNTNYTYLATLGDNVTGNRRSDFYFQDADNAACDTCFLRLTDSLPITANATFGDPNPITGIAVDPRDGNRVWVSFSGFDSNIKVYYSADAGLTWTNYDDDDGSLANLNMPINDIQYQRGTNDRLYIATDVGIYVREAGGNWLRYGNDFPNVRTTELKINYCLGKLRAATFGRGAWEADLLEPREEIAFRSFRTIGTNQTWNTDKNMTRDLKVMAGATLTLSNMTLNMPKGGLIIVEPGGKLVVDSSTITNLCGQTWVGIQIWGNSALTQTPTQNQGHLVLNESTIEHAKEAMSPWQVDNYNGTGGIIEATNTTFRNNWRTSGFVKYISPVGAREKSRFTNCTFTVNDDLRTFNNQPNSFLGHLSMWAIGGMIIEGCTFRDERTSKSGDAYGILSLSGAPHILSQQLTTITGPRRRNTFEGIERAVEIGGMSQHRYTTFVDQSDFIDNEQALTIREHDGAKVIRNTFRVGGFDSNNPPASGVFPEYGVGFINSGSFDAEQNSFEATNATDWVVGSWLDATGTTDNNIFNNDYTEMPVANIAHGDNRGTLPSEGTQYLCNTNTNNWNDFAVVDNFNNTATNVRIALNQGASSAATQNTFSDLSTPRLDWHFFNDSTSGGSPINYFYDQNVPAEEPATSRIQNVFKGTGSKRIGFCDDKYTIPSTTSNTGNNGGPMLRSTMKNKHYAAKSAYTQYQSEYAGKLDNGDTEVLLQTIEETPPAEKGDLKDYLLSIAPFLSQEALLFTTGVGLYNAYDLKDIIMANPDVIRASGFMTKLSNVVNSPLTVNDLEEIASSPANTQIPNTPAFARTELTSKLGDTYRELNFWATEVYREYANDTIVPNPDTLLVWLQHKEGMSAKYAVVEHYWRTGQEAKAFDELMVIKNTYNLQGIALQNHEALVEIKTLFQNIAAEDRNIAQLEREEVIQLEDIAELKAGTASSQAANIVSFFYTPSTRYYPYLAGEGRSGGYKGTIEQSSEPITTSNLQGYPNPAINWVDLIYELPIDNTRGMVYITASNGQLLDQIDLNQRMGSLTLNTTTWAPGIYFASLWTNDHQRLNVYKIIVRK